MKNLLMLPSLSYYQLSLLIVLYVQVDLSHSKDFEPEHNLSITNKKNSPNKLIIVKKSRKD